MNIIYDLDRAAQLLLQNPAVQDRVVLRVVVSAFSWWGGAGVIWAAALLWLGARALKRLPVSELGLRGAEGIAVASAISGVVKALAGRSRPFFAPSEPWHWDFAHGWTDARYFSMPSGHVTATFAFATAAAVAAMRFRPVPRAFLIVGLLASACLVGFARMYLDQHWLSDVVAGALLGGATGFMLARWHARHPPTAFDRAMLGATARDVA